MQCTMLEGAVIGAVFIHKPCHRVVEFSSLCMYIRITCQHSEEATLMDHDRTQDMRSDKITANVGEQKRDRSSGWRHGCFDLHTICLHQHFTKDHRIVPYGTNYQRNKRRNEIDHHFLIHDIIILFY